MGRKPKLPGDADITVKASVRARQLRFGERPQTSTEFSGTPGHESDSGSDRVNLPEQVEKDVTYRRVRVDYRLAAALVYPAEAEAPRPGISPDEERRSTRSPAAPTASFRR
jgi:hypothetical protein